MGREWIFFFKYANYLLSGGSAAQDKGDEAPGLFTTETAVTACAAPQACPLTGNPYWGAWVSQGPAQTHICVLFAAFLQCDHTEIPLGTSISPLAVSMQDHNVIKCLDQGLACVSAQY